MKYLKNNKYLYIFTFLLNFILFSIPFYAKTENKTESVAIKNEFKPMEYLYEDQGILKYGIFIKNDLSFAWDIEDHGSYKTIKNKKSGNFLNINSYKNIKDKFNLENVSVSEYKNDKAFHWALTKPEKVGVISEVSGVGNEMQPTANIVVNYISGMEEMEIMKTSFNITSKYKKDFILHVEDQKEDGSVACSDLNTSWESGKWVLENYSKVNPTFRISSKIKTWKYLADNGNEISLEDANTDSDKYHWYAERSEDGTVLLKNKATGKYLQADYNNKAINSTDNINSKGLNWVLAGKVNNKNLYFNINSDISYENKKFFGYKINIDNSLLLSDSDETNSKSLWKFEDGSKPLNDTLLPKEGVFRFKNEALGVFLYENEQGQVAYGKINKENEESSQWTVNVKKGIVTLKNLKSKKYLTLEKDGKTLSSSPKFEDLASSWSIKEGVEGYKVIKNLSNIMSSLNIESNKGIIEYSNISLENTNSQWVIAVSSSISNSYVTIQNGYRSENYIYEEDGKAKYGKIKDNDFNAQWIIEEYEDYVKIKNRATGHYINIEGMDPTNLLDIVKAGEIAGNNENGKWILENKVENAKTISVKFKSKARAFDYLNNENSKSANPGYYTDYIQCYDIPSNYGTTNWILHKISK